MRNVKKLSVRRTADLCNIPPASVWRIGKETPRRTKRCSDVVMATARRRGRPRKLTAREGRLLLRGKGRLRLEEGNFTASDVIDRAGICKYDISLRTVTRFLNQNGYFYLQTRKKGLLSFEDVKQRLAYAKNCQKRISQKIIGRIWYHFIWIGHPLHIKQIRSSNRVHQRAEHGDGNQRVCN